jgi:hypothetical protein
MYQVRPGLPFVLLFVSLLGFMIMVPIVDGRDLKGVDFGNLSPARVSAGNSFEPELLEPVLLDDTGTNCRYGAAAWGSQPALLPSLKVGWYYNFGVSAAGSVVPNVEFVQIVRINQKRDANGARLPDYTLVSPTSNAALVSAVNANKGALWLIGNEPDRVFWQDDIFPDIYAKAYHELYYLIKNSDPTAKIGIAGLVQVTPGRLQYLDIVWDSYIQRYGAAIPVDVWNMHVYILPEARINDHGQLVGSRAGIALGTDPALAILESDGTPNQCGLSNVYCNAQHDDMSIFMSQVVAMRNWMKNKGQQNKPLILSEFSLLYPFDDYDDPVNPTQCYLMDEYGNCFTPTRVRNFMLQVFNHLETAADPALGYPLDNNRLVQQWLWYAVHDSAVGSPNRLVNEDATLTLVGQAFANHISNRPLFRNLLVEQVPTQVVFTPTAGGSATATLSVKFRNNGNTAVSTSFTVTFYRDAQRQQPIGSVVVPAGITRGCARDDYEVNVPWSNLGAGTHQFWVTLDSNNVVAETSKDDNLGSGYVLVNSKQIFLPALRR